MPTEWNNLIEYGDDDDVHEPFPAVGLFEFRKYAEENVSFNLVPCRMETDSIFHKSHTRCLFIYDFPVLSLVCHSIQR